MSKKILVVDDEKDVLLMLNERLASSGYDIITAEDGKTAITMAREENPDLIILDIMMPGIDGTETAKILKSNPKTRDIPIIFLTCLVKKEEDKDGQVIGGHYFIAKPYSSEKLIEAIEKNIRK